MTLIGYTMMCEQAGPKQLGAASGRQIPAGWGEGGALHLTESPSS
jgi:hypothetical protein